MLRCWLYFATITADYMVAKYAGLYDVSDERYSDQARPETDWESHLILYRLQDRVCRSVVEKDMEMSWTGSFVNVEWYVWAKS